MNVLSHSPQGTMNLLAIDTAGAACSAALWVDGQIVSSRLCEMVRGQAEALMPMVADVMNEAQAKFSDLDLIAVTVGPGSFTGLRTGVAAAQGLALARSLPLIAVTTTEAVALAAHHQVAAGNPPRLITVALSSRRNDLYVQNFSAELNPLGDPFTALPDEIVRTISSGNVIVAGDATEQIKGIVRSVAEEAQVTYVPVIGPDAVFVAEVAARRWRSRSAGEKLIPNKLLYLRAPDAVQPADQGRLRP